MAKQLYYVANYVKNHQNLNTSEESNEICHLVVVLLAVLGVAVRRMELRCTDFLKRYLWVRALKREH